MVNPEMITEETYPGAVLAGAQLRLVHAFATVFAAGAAGVLSGRDIYRAGGGVRLATHSGR